MNKNMEEAWIQFAAGANPATVGRLLQEVTNLVAGGVKKINLLLSTPGGMVLNGMTAYNFLRALPVTIVTYNIGRVDSIGGIMFLAADERYAVPNSAFLIHGIAWNFGQGANIPEKQMKEIIGSMTKDRQNIAQVFTERLGVADEVIEKMMVEGQTLSTQEALELHLIQNVRAPQITEGARVITITD